MAVGGTHNPQAYHPMAIALLSGRAQTLATKHGERSSSPVPALCASYERVQQVEPLTRSVDWGLSQESMRNGSGTIPRALTYSIEGGGTSQSIPIELSSDDDDVDNDKNEEDKQNGKDEDHEDEEKVAEVEKEMKEFKEVEEEEEEGDNDHKHSTPLQPAGGISEGTIEPQPGNTDVEASSVSTIDSSAEYMTPKTQHNSEDSLLIYDDARDLSKADDIALHNMLMQAQQDDGHDQDDAAAKLIQLPKFELNEEHAYSTKNIPNGKALKNSVGKPVDILLKGMLDEGLLAVQEASQVHYDGAAKEWKAAPMAGLSAETSGPIIEDETDSIARVGVSIVSAIESYQSALRLKKSEFDFVKPKERGKASTDVNKERVKHTPQSAGVQAEQVTDMTICGLQAATRKDYLLKQDASEREKREAQQKKKTAALVERRSLLDLDKAEQLRKAEADRAFKNQKDPEKAGISIAAQVLRAQRDREREREREGFKSGVAAKDPARAAGSGEKSCVPLQSTETHLVNGTSARVMPAPDTTAAITPAINPAFTSPILSATTSATTFTTASASATTTTPVAVQTESASSTPATFPAIAETTTSDRTSVNNPAPNTATAHATAWVTTPPTAPATLPPTISATVQTISPADTIKVLPFVTSISSFSWSPSSSQQSVAIVGKCAADQPLTENERVSPVPLQDAEENLRTSFEGCHKRKPQTAILSFEKHIEGAVHKKVRSNEPTSQQIKKVVAPGRQSSGYAGTARSPSGTPSGITSPESRRIRLTTPERKESRRLSALKYRKRKAQERSLARTAGSRASTASQSSSSSYPSQSVSGTYDGDGKAVSPPIRMGFAALPRLSPSPSNGNLKFPEPVSKKGHTKQNETSRNSGVKRDRKQEYPRLKERQRLQKQKNDQRGLGNSSTSFTTSTDADADADDEIYFDSMDPMEVDPVEVDRKPGEELPRPMTGGKTITQEMLDILQQKPESLLSFVDDSPYQEMEQDATYYEFVVKRLSWTDDNDDDDAEDIEPLICHTGYIDVSAANKAAGDEIFLERGDSKVYPLDDFHWKKDRDTGMATYEGSSAAGAVRVFVDRILRPRGAGLEPSKRALKAARRISPIVYVILVKNTTTTTTTVAESTDNDDDDELFADAPLPKPTVNVTVDVCRTRDLANKVASKYVLERLRKYQAPGELGEIERAESEGEQRRYLEELEEGELLYMIEPALLGEGDLLEVWVEEQFLKGPCN